VRRRRVNKSDNETVRSATPEQIRSRTFQRAAKLLAAKRHTSISGLLAAQLERLVGDEDGYEQAQRHALALLDEGFSLGGRIAASRDEWHDR